MKAMIILVAVLGAFFGIYLLQFVYTLSFAITQLLMALIILGGLWVIFKVVTRKKDRNETP